MQRVCINFTYKRKTLKRGIEPNKQGCKKFKIKNKYRNSTNNLPEH